MLLLVAALQNAGAQGLAEAEAEPGTSEAEERGSPAAGSCRGSSSRPAAAPADVQQAAAVHGAAQFWAGQHDFGADLAGGGGWRSWSGGAGGRSWSGAGSCCV